MADLREDLRRRRKDGFQVFGEGLQTAGAILGGRAVPQFQEAEAELSFLEKEEIKQQIGQENLENKLRVQTQIDAQNNRAVRAEELRQDEEDVAIARRNRDEANTSQQGLRTSQLANIEKEGQLASQGIAVPPTQGIQPQPTTLTGEPVQMPQAQAPISSGVGGAIAQAQPVPGIGSRELEAVQSTLPTTKFDEATQRNEPVPAEFKIQETRGSEIAGATLQSQSIEGAKQQLKTDTSFNKVVGLMQGLVSQFKLKRSQQNDRAGLLPGLAGDLRVMFKDPTASGIASFEGQRNETAFALNSIITGQNRVIKGVLKLILDTIPDGKDPDSFVAQKISQTLINSRRLQRAVQKANLSVRPLNETHKYKDQNGNEVEEQLFGYVDPSGRDVSAKELENLMNTIIQTPEEDAAFQPFIQQVLDTPMAKEQSFNFGDEESGQQTQSPSGGREMTDDEGNRAIVFPDGTFEEIQ